VTALQAIAISLVALGGPAVVLTRDPMRQAVVTGIFGLTLALLFFAFQAPDVALSQIVVGAVGLPVMILLTISKVRQREERDEAEGGSGGR
jgi:uncharacterized MnhB-related membrane protein